MGEMYSVFLKYALGDGKEIGIVLTPPYVTKMMAEILGVDRNSKVMDKTTPRLIQFHTLKNAVNPPFLGGFSIFNTVVA